LDQDGYRTTDLININPSIEPDDDEVVLKEEIRNSATNIATSIATTISGTAVTTALAADPVNLCSSNTSAYFTVKGAASYSSSNPLTFPRIEAVGSSDKSILIRAAGAGSVVLGRNSDNNRLSVVGNTLTAADSGSSDVNLNVEAKGWSGVLSLKNTGVTIPLTVTPTASKVTLNAGAVNGDLELTTTTSTNVVSVPSRCTLSGAVTTISSATTNLTGAATTLSGANTTISSASTNLTGTQTSITGAAVLSGSCFLNLRRFYGELSANTTLTKGVVTAPNFNTVPAGVHNTFGSLGSWVNGNGFTNQSGRDMYVVVHCYFASNYTSNTDHYYIDSWFTTSSDGATVRWGRKISNYDNTGSHKEPMSEYIACPIYLPNNAAVKINIFPDSTMTTSPVIYYADGVAGQGNEVGNQRAYFLVQQVG
jgi:hypothetical protein